MYTTNYLVGSNPNPEAYITKGKNRIKQHDDVVYLNDQDRFEIEIFNPKTISVLVKIKINGNYISNRGLVVKPGQRIHLDRHLDEAKKFLFSTYEVSGTNEQVEKAIQFNGLVEVEFYDQTILSGTSGFGGCTWIATTPYVYDNTQPNYIEPNIFYCNSTSVNYSQNTSFTSNVVGAVAKVLQSKSIETGRVEKGDDSNTKLKDVNMDFSSFSTHSVTWKILPNSQKPVEVSELRGYCTDCGSKIKKTTWKFCPTCGNKL